MYYFSCPSCTNNARFYRVRRDADAGLSSVLIFLFGGLLATVCLLSYDRRPRVQCAACGFIFRKPAMGRSPVATAAMAVFYCVLLAGLLGVIVEHDPDVFAMVPGWSHVLVAGEFIKEHATGVAAAGLAGILSAGLLASGIAVVANARHHRRIIADYEHRPTELPPQPAAPAPPIEPPSHCASCGYDLTGNESGVCPECGVPTGGARPD